MRRGDDVFGDWANIPHFGDGAHLYAVELSNGVVKVGYSTSPRNRMGSLNRTVRREFGCKITKFHIGHSLELRACQAAEKALVQHMRRIADPLPGRSEYFAGVEFDKAVSLIGQPHVQPPVDVPITLEQLLAAAIDEIERLRAVIKAKAVA